MKRTATTTDAARLSSEFYRRATVRVARGLLGKLLVRRNQDSARLSGIVVEVEAYLSHGDAASHSHRGLGKKNAAMFMAAGTLYVYPIHSRHCLNVVTEGQGRGAAVLIRALEPYEGIDAMAQLRGLDVAVCSGERPSCRQALALTSGPGRLCQALAVDRTFSGIDLVASQQIWLEDCPLAQNSSWKIRGSSRIGISQARELPLRWFIDGHRFVSGRAGEHGRGRHWSFLPWP